jgi:hypothetical protein
VLIYTVHIGLKKSFTPAVAYYYYCGSNYIEDKIPYLGWD